MNTSYLNKSEPIQKHKNHLPHWQQENSWQFITWHLGDALPLDARQKLQSDKQAWLKTHPKPWAPDTEKEYYQLFESRVQKWLDAGIGSCLLRHRSVREQVENSLKYGEGKEYLLDRFVIMPTHVHVLMLPIKQVKLEKILQGIKSSSSHKINHSLKRHGTLWMEDYWDRMIRNPAHYQRVQLYIRNNPQKANLPPHAYTYWQKE